jgi:peptidyl-prolyl cis-trans isomerase C
MTNNPVVFTLTLILSLSSSNVCAQPDQGNHPPAAAVSVTDSTVLARIGDQYTVTMGEFQKILSDFPGIYDSVEKKRDFLRIFILEKAYMLAAEKEGLHKSPQVQKELAGARDKGLASLYQRKFVFPLITGDRARQYMTAHAEEFAIPARVEVWQILVKQAEKAMEIKAALAAGAKFEELAEQDSVDEATKHKGGSVGWVNQGTWLPEFETVVFNLEPGQISNIVETPSGYYIFKVGSKQPTRPREPDAALAAAVLKVKSDVIESVKAELMQHWKVSINDELLKQYTSPLPGRSEKSARQNPTEIVAHVGDRLIRVKDLDEALASALRTAPLTYEDHKVLLAGLILNTLYSLEAENVGLDKTPQFQKETASMREKILTDAYINTHIPPLLTEERAREYYHEHQKEWMAPTKVLAQHILVQTEVEARSIKAELDKGADFAELAKEKSIDRKTALTGGHLGWIYGGQTEPDFERAAFSLEPGQISDVVKTSAGYHIIKVKEKIPSYQAVRGIIIARLRTQAYQTLEDTVMKRLDVNINYELLKDESAEEREGGDH